VQLGTNVRDRRGKYFMLAKSIHLNRAPEKCEFGFTYPVSIHLISSGEQACEVGK
jgi:hypothetical protein